MIEQIYNYFDIEMLFYLINFGVLPFWLILIFFPQSSICKYFVVSIFPLLILTGTYIFILYKSYLNSYDFLMNFSLYLGINNLINLFSNELFLLMFWTHFISINLFTGGWILNNAQKYSINKILLIIPLTTTYLVGPFGLIIYWIIRIFYAKNINLYD